MEVITLATPRYSLTSFFSFLLDITHFIVLRFTVLDRSCTLHHFEARRHESLYGGGSGPSAIPLRSARS